MRRVLHFTKCAGLSAVVRARISGFRRDLGNDGEAGEEHGSAARMGLRTAAMA
jgi:hypothetical protein